MFRKVAQKTEPLYDLDTGHVAIELIKPGQQPLEVDSEAFQICKDGQEVTMGKSHLREKLGQYSQSHGVHDVTWSGKTQPKSIEHAEDPALETELDASYDLTSDDDDEAGIMETTVQRSRMRAASFYRELTPGWRARAKDLSPPYQVRDVGFSQPLPP